jgi:hypothetical protein
MICCNRLSEPGTANGAYSVNRSARPRNSTDARGNLSFTTREQIVRDVTALPISAVFRLRYLHDVMRVWGRILG